MAIIKVLVLDKENFIVLRDTVYNKETDYDLIKEMEVVLKFDITSDSYTLIPSTIISKRINNDEQVIKYFEVLGIGGKSIRSIKLLINQLCDNDLIGNLFLDDNSKEIIKDDLLFYQTKPMKIYETELNNTLTIKKGDVDLKVIGGILNMDMEELSNLSF